uniref:hypothetical protein n=1 Tax=Salmonella enterica TaxID=28901 RepID=UPI00398C37C8
RHGGGEWSESARGGELGIAGLGEGGSSEWVSGRGAAGRGAGGMGWLVRGRGELDGRERELGIDANSVVEAASGAGSFAAPAGLLIGKCGDTRA